MAYQQDFEQALQVGRPPTITSLFPNSRALIVSGKVVDRAMRAKGKAIAMAANGRNSFVIRGALRAAQRANAALIIEIAKSEGGQKAYCAVNYWNMARIVDAFCNEMGITVPVAIHADHYGIKNDKDLAQAKVEVPTMFEAGMTSIAIDASHQPNDRNLLANLAIDPFIPKWSGLETEVGEIKGSTGLSTPDEALFLIQGLNAHGIVRRLDRPEQRHHARHRGVRRRHPGRTDGRRPRRPRALRGQRRPARHVGQQLRAAARDRRQDAHHEGERGHRPADDLLGPRGQRLRQRAARRRLASFVKVEGEGVTEEMWAAMVAYADERGWKKGDYKNLNIAFENRFLAQPAEIRERMSRRVEDFAYKMMTEVFNAEDTAPLAVEAILDAGSHDLGPKVGQGRGPRRLDRREDRRDGRRRWTATRASGATSTIEGRPTRRG